MKLETLSDRVTSVATHFGVTADELRAALRCPDCNAETNIGRVPIIAFTIAHDDTCPAVGRTAGGRTCPVTVDGEHRGTLGVLHVRKGDKS